MSEQSKYVIRTVEDFLSVPADKRDECLEDFRQWLEIASHKSAMERAMDDLTGIEGAMTMRVNEFHWVDDGQRGVSDITVNGESVRGSE